VRLGHEHRDALFRALARELHCTEDWISPVFKRMLLDRTQFWTPLGVAQLGHPSAGELVNRLIAELPRFHQALRQDPSGWRARLMRAHLRSHDLDPRVRDQLHDFDDRYDAWRRYSIAQHNRHRDKADPEINARAADYYLAFMLQYEVGYSPPTSEIFEQLMDYLGMDDTEPYGEQVRRVYWALRPFRDALVLWAKSDQGYREVARWLVHPITRRHARGPRAVKGKDSKGSKDSSAAA